MKALSIRQPWAELIIQGRKTIELRTWATRYRGVLIIHAGYIVDEEACKQFGLDPTTIAHGALIGTVELVDIIALTSEQYEALYDAHLATDDWPSEPLYGWQFQRPQTFQEPLPAQGQPGLYTISDNLLTF